MNLSNYSCGIVRPNGCYENLLKEVLPLNTIRRYEHYYSFCKKALSEYFDQGAIQLAVGGKEFITVIHAVDPDDATKVLWSINLRELPEEIESGECVILESVKQFAIKYINNEI